MNLRSTAARRDTAVQYPETQKDVNGHFMQYFNETLTKVQKLSEPVQAAAEALGTFAQLQHTAYCPQQPASTEQIIQLAASRVSLSQKTWHIRHMRRPSPRCRPQWPCGANAWPLAHCREKMTAFGHTLPSWSIHSEPKLCEAMTRRLAVQKEPRQASFAPSASTSTTHRVLSGSQEP